MLMALRRKGRQGGKKLAHLSMGRRGVSARKKNAKKHMVLTTVSRDSDIRLEVGARRLLSRQSAQRVDAASIR
jgi:hypothetical protein